MSEPASSNIPWPPLVHIGCAAAALVAHAIYPLPWLGSPGRDILFVIGLMIAAAGIALGVSAVRRLRKAGTTVMPTRPSAHLVIDGPFAITRNPIYLGYVLLTLGAALVFAIGWLVPAALLGAWFARKLAIEPEERHLTARFGRRFLEYRKKVRRWI